MWKKKKTTEKILPGTGDYHLFLRRKGVLSFVNGPEARKIIAW
jgi:hypothetical protein